MDDCLSTLSLEKLPTEILLHILQYLEVEFIKTVVSKVCAYFNSIAKDPMTWRVRLSRRFVGQFPPIPPPEDFSWSKACHFRETEAFLWGKADKMTASLTCSTAHYAAVDAVHVMDNVVVSGSRDRGISIWTLDQVFKGNEEAIKPALRNPDMHKGWVWCFSSQDDSLVSGSWDNTVKFWQVTPTDLSQTRKAINLKVAVLSTDILGNKIVAGTYDKKVIQLDKRQEERKMSYFRVHSKPVLAVKVTDRHILSLSEDQTLAVYDRAAAKRLKKVTIPGQQFPICMSLQGNSLWVGDKGGNLHLLDLTGDSFEVVDTINKIHSGRVTSLHSGLGSLITASSDGDIKVFHPSRRPELITTLKNPDCGEAAQISYNEKKEILAAGFSNNTVKIWAAKPRH